MSKQALIFGGIGTLLECSELQREAFNLAFAEAGLDWRWPRENYRTMLVAPGGADRVLRYAAAMGDSAIDEAAAAKLHAAKTRFFHERLSRGGLSPRPGVLRLIEEAQRLGTRLGYATTTDSETAVLVLEAVGLSPASFDTVCHRDLVTEAKPSPAVYHYCLDGLGVEAASAVAIEDSESGLQAATAAGVACVVTLGENTRMQKYEGAALVLRDLGDEVALERILSDEIAGVGGPTATESIVDAGEHAA